MNFIDTLEKIVPFLMLIPGFSKYIPLITAGIAVAEASAQPGKVKKDIALKSVRAGAISANLIAGYTVIDPDKAASFADTAIDQIVNLVNVNLDLSSNTSSNNLTGTKTVSSFDDLIK